MISLTAEARQKLQEASEQHGFSGAFLFGAQGGGCSGYKYIFGIYEGDVDDDFESFDMGGFLIVVHKKALPLVDGTTIDFKTDGLTSGFTFDNPKAVKACGCASSFTVSPGGSCGT